MAEDSKCEAELCEEIRRLREYVAALEQQYRSVIEDSPGLLCSFLPDGKIAFVNDTYCRYFGKAREDLIGREFTSLIPEGDRKKVLDRILSLSVDSPSMTHEHKVIAPDGQVRWHRWTNRALFDEQGRAVLFQSFGEDITEHKKAEEALKQSEETFRLAMETTNDALWDWNVVTNEVYRNPRHATMLGYEPGELSASQEEWEKRIHPEDKALVFGAVQEHLAGGRDSIEVEYRLKTKSGDYIWVLGRGKVVAYGDDGAPVRMIGTNIDITERRKALEAIREKQSLIQGILDHANSIIVVRDIHGRYIMVNREAESVLGMDSRQIIGKTPYDIHARDKAERILSDDKKVIESRKPLPIEDQLVVKGEARTFLGARFPLLNPANEPYAVCTVVADITQRKKAEDALRESEERYRTLVESAGETIATIDINGVFTFMNTTAAKRLGGAPKDFTGKTMWDLFPKETADRQVASVRKAITTGRGANVIVPTDVQGQLRWYNTTIEPLRDSFGEVTAALIVARDIHELRQAEDQIRNLSSAVEQSMDGVATADAKSHLAYVNEAFAHMHGYSRQEMVGMSAADLYSQDQGDRYRETFVQTGKDGSYAGQAWHVRKDGAEFPCYISLTLVKNDRAEVIGTVAVCRDMTEARQKQEELNRYRAQMARAEQLASLGTLSATVAHQITQPLTVIRLSLENTLDELEGTSCPDKAVRRLQDSVTQVLNITDIINRFRNFARQSSDTRFGQVNVNVIAERVVRLLEETARQARVTLHLKDMGKLPPVIMNETDLEQVFFALLENAIQAADRRQARRIAISGVIKDDRVELCFSDNCGGIAPEIRDKVFEPFFTTKPRGYGTGLGLCIVHDAVTRAGGHVRLESKLGRGTTFFVGLPVPKEGV